MQLRTLLCNFVLLTSYFSAEGGSAFGGELFSSQFDVQRSEFAVLGTKFNVLSYSNLDYIKTPKKSKKRGFPLKDHMMDMLLF